MYVCYNIFVDLLTYKIVMFWEFSPFVIFTMNCFFMS